MVKPATGARYQHPDHLFAFLEKYPQHDSIYVMRTARMIQDDYPASADEMLPRLRKIYADKVKAERNSRN